MMIDILIPSRGRGERLQQTISSIIDTADNILLVNIIVKLDVDDDLSHYSYLNDISFVKVIIGFNDILSKHWNACFESGSGEIVMHGSDDIIFESKGWDTKVREFFKEGKIALLYGRDGHQDSKMSTHSFTLRKAANIIGVYLPPYFTADGNDVWLFLVYTGLNRISYDSSIVTMHNHVNVDSKYEDDTYAIARERRLGVAPVWREHEHEIDEWVAKLKEYV